MLSQEPASFPDSLTVRQGSHLTSTSCCTRGGKEGFYATVLMTSETDFPLEFSKASVHSNETPSPKNLMVFFCRPHIVVRAWPDRAHRARFFVHLPSLIISQYCLEITAGWQKTVRTVGMWFSRVSSRKFTKVEHSTKMTLAFAAQNQ